MADTLPQDQDDERPQRIIGAASTPKIVFESKDDGRLSRSNDDYSKIMNYKWNASYSKKENLLLLMEIGFKVIPTSPNSKKIKYGYKNKVDTFIDPDDISADDNFSICLGRYDEGPLKGYHLIDLDLETKALQILARFYFNNFKISTPTFGRISAPCNHYLFLIKDEDSAVFRNKKYFDLQVKEDTAKSQFGEIVLELKAHAHVLAPKSWHPSDGTREQLFWMSNNTEFTTLSWKEIIKHMGQLMTAYRLSEFFVEGNRDNLTFSTTSWLLKEGVSIEVITNIFQTIFDYHGTTIQDRSQLISTISRIYTNYQNSSIIEKKAFGGMKGFIDSIGSTVKESTYTAAVAQMIKSELFDEDTISYDDTADLKVNEINESFLLDGPGTIKRYKYLYNNKIGSRGKIIGMEFLQLTQVGFSNLVNVGSYKCPVKDNTGAVRYVPLSSYWLQSPKAKKVDEIIFDSDKPCGFFEDISITTGKIVKSLNTWFGWPNVPIEGKENSWPTIEDFLKNIICDGIQERYKWLLDLLAFKIQNPSKLSEICLILHGEQFIGKSFFTDVFCTKLFGKHNSNVTAVTEDLISRFNGNIAGKLLVVFPEIVASSFKERRKISESMKNFATNTTIAKEEKGVDKIEIKNAVQILITTNNWRNVPIGDDKRRYCIITLSTREKNNALYFAKVNDALNHEEMNHFMHYLTFQHNVCGEDPHEEITNEFLSDLYEEAVENNDYSIITKLFEERDRRALTQLAYINSTKPITEELEEMQASNLNRTYDDIMSNNLAVCIENFLMYGYVNANKYHPDINERVFITAADLRAQFFEHMPKLDKETIKDSISRQLRKLMTSFFAVYEDGKQYNIFRTEINAMLSYMDKGVSANRSIRPKSVSGVSYNKSRDSLDDGNLYLSVTRKGLFDLLHREHFTDYKLERLDSIFDEGMTSDDGDSLPTLDEVGKHIHGEERWLELKVKGNNPF